jgi:DNA invertase Pin-like site-specific DNA recombinase
MSTPQNASAATFYGYVRVSTDQQHDEGAGLPAQIARIQAEATARAWTLEIISEGAGRSGGSLTGRAALAEALDRLDAGQAAGLLVAKLDRLARSTADFLKILERSQRNGWALVILDLGVDTSTAVGEMVATVMAAFATYERRLIAQRTREALAERRAQGVILGRPAAMAADVRSRIHTERAEGSSLRTIANSLNVDGVATVHGGAAWYASTVRAALRLSA